MSPSLRTPLALRTLLTRRTFRTLIFLLVIVAVAVGYTATSVGDGSFGIWMDTGNPTACPQGQRCAEWCEWDGNGLAGTGEHCCIPEHSINTDDHRACRQRVN